MVEAELVIWFVFLDVNVPILICSIGVFVVYGSVSDLGSIFDIWFVAHVEGIVCVIGDFIFWVTSCVRLLFLELSKGFEFDFVVFIDIGLFGMGIEGVVDCYVVMI